MTNGYKKIFIRHMCTQNGTVKIMGPTRDEPDNEDSFVTVTLDETDIALRSSAYLTDPPHGFKKPKARKALGECAVVGYIIVKDVIADFLGLIYHPVAQDELNRYRKKIEWRNV